MVLTLNNVREELEKGGVLPRERIYRSGNRWKRYRLLKDVHVRLSDGKIIHIPKGFEWDLSSVPRLFWTLLPPDGDFEIAALIHDYLYTHQITTRAFADREMFLWSKKTNGTRRMSIRNIDNYTRYYGVVALGWTRWNA